MAVNFCMAFLNHPTAILFSLGARLWRDILEDTSEQTDWSEFYYGCNTPFYVLTAMKDVLELASNAHDWIQCETFIPFVGPPFTLL